MNTLLLDTSDWDVCLDAAGNIAMATAPYALAQDVASACQLFLGELWYDTSKGVPWFAEILGQLPPLPLIQQRLTEAALTVPGVVSATVQLDPLAADRRLTGAIIFTDQTGVTGRVSI